MNTWQRLLRDHDPAFTPHDTRLDPDAAGELRAAVVAAAAARQQPVPRNWRQPLAMAAVVALMIGAGVVAGYRLELRAKPVPAVAIDEPAELRQLQFATPGGTRIIWVFNPEFDLKETTP